MGHHSKKSRKSSKSHKDKKDKKCPECPPCPVPLDCTNCKSDYDSQVKPILDVAIDPDFVPYLLANGDGTFSGFDIDLITAIAQRLPCVNYIRFTPYDFGNGEVFFAVTSGDADILADSSNSITQARISSGFVTEGQVNGMGAIATDATRSTQVILFYRVSNDPDSVDQILTNANPAPTPETVLAILADATTPPIITGLGTSSIQNATLRFNADNISTAPDAVQGSNNASDATTIKDILDNQAGGIGGFLSNAQTAAQASLVIDGELKFIEASLAPTVITRANGYFVRDDRCKLMQQVQKALDEVIASGEYAQIVANNIALYDPETDEGAANIAILEGLQAPTRCLSILRHYIPKTCSDSCWANACNSDSACRPVPHSVTVLPPLNFSP